MSSLIVMESSSNSNDMDTSIVNMNEEQQQLLVLPEDIVLEILLWLPVVSLLRFKSVCKSWCSLIQTSSFISQHKDKNTGRHNLLLMLPCAEEVGGHNVIFKVLSSCGGGGRNNNNYKFQTYENLDLPEYFKINNRSKRSKMVICDGIICFHHPLGADVSLWNPATKQFRILPRSQLPLPLLMHQNNNGMLFGFGFDVETNDYKVVRVAYLTGKSRTPFLPSRSPVSANTYNKIEVYSLTNNSWKTLDFVLPIDFVFSDPKMPLPYHNGGIYCWIGRDRDEDYIDDHGGMPLILSFDFRKEIFGTISLPNDPIFQHGCFPQLAILREKLATIKGIDFIYYQIWVMNEFGVRESWTKLHTVGPFSYSQPIGFPKNEDLFLLLKDKKQICSCNPVTGQINNLPALDRSFNVPAAVYKESLLPV